MTLPIFPSKWRVEPPAGSKAAAVGTAEISNKQKVESELAKLQNAQRLAIHVWEDDMEGREEFQLRFPARTQRFLHWTQFDDRITADSIPKLLSTGKMPQLSMSLVPSLATEAAMKPFNCSAMALSYLVNLDQNIKHPAAVIAVSKSNIYSGPSPFSKQAKLVLCKKYLPALADIYENHDMSHWLSMLASDGKGAHNLSSRQLDILHDSIAQKEKSNEPIGHNEVLASVAPEHIKAIALPHHITDGCDENYVTVLRVIAAMAGLQHLQKGVDLPVVMYQISNKDSTSAKEHPHGSIFYLGQGKVELSKIALDGIKKLSELGREAVSQAIDDEKTLSYTILRQAIWHTFSLDIRYPLDKQTKPLSQLENDARGACPAI